MSDELLRAILANNPNLCFGGRELDQAELDLIKECRWDEPVRQSIMVEADGTCNFDIICTEEQGAAILEGDSYVFPQRLGPRTMIREVIPPCPEYPTGGAFYHETQPTIFRGKISIYHHAEALAEKDKRIAELEATNMALRAANLVLKMDQALEQED